MPITIETLKSRGVDYLIASVEEGELLLEPFCSCGNPLDENYHCPTCGKVCDCKIIACSDTQSLAIVEKIVPGNPTFRNFEVSLIVN